MSDLGGVFGFPGVAKAYRHRPPYPDEVFDVLESLISDRPRTVLDIGAGEGALARPLARRADHVDALDISAAMVAEVLRNKIRNVFPASSILVIASACGILETWSFGKSATTCALHSDTPG